MPNRIVDEKREADISITNSGGIPRIEETYVFLVEAESKNTSRFSVSQTPNLPVVNVSASSFGLTICKSKNCVRRENSPTLWDVTCVFSSEVEEGQDSQDPETNPTAWIPIYETKFERVQVVVTRDFAGNVVANSAKERFPVGLTVTRKLPVWEFYQFEPATVSDETIIDRSETVNSTTFRGKASDTLLCTVVSSSIGFYYGNRLRFTRYSLMYDKLTWKHKRLDVGRSYLDGTTRKPYLLDGVVIDGNLNGTGGKVAANAPPAILEFEMYDSIDFNSFIRVPS
jgi:hypothetical protein